MLLAICNKAADATLSSTFMSMGCGPDVSTEAPTDNCIEDPPPSWTDTSTNTYPTRRTCRCDALVVGTLASPTPYQRRDNINFGTAFQGCFGKFSNVNETYAQIRASALPIFRTVVVPLQV